MPKSRVTVDLKKRGLDYTAKRGGNRVAADRSRQAVQRQVREDLHDEMEFQVLRKAARPAWIGQVAAFVNAFSSKGEITPEVAKALNKALADFERNSLALEQATASRDAIQIRQLQRKMNSDLRDDQELVQGSLQDMLLDTVYVSEEARTAASQLLQQIGGAVPAQQAGQAQRPAQAASPAAGEAGADATSGKAARSTMRKDESGGGSGADATVGTEQGLVARDPSANKDTKIEKEGESKVYVKRGRAGDVVGGALMEPFSDPRGFTWRVSSFDPETGFRGFRLFTGERSAKMEAELYGKDQATPEELAELSKQPWWPASAKLGKSDSEAKAEKGSHRVDYDPSLEYCPNCGSTQPADKPACGHCSHKGLLPVYVCGKCFEQFHTRIDASNHEKAGDTVKSSSVNAPGGPALNAVAKVGQPAVQIEKFAGGPSEDFSTFARLVPLSKRAEDQQLVEGFASSSKLDTQDDIVDRLAIPKATPDFMKWANLREMHENIAAGTVLVFEPVSDDVTLLDGSILKFDKKARSVTLPDDTVVVDPIHIIAHVENKDSWGKVKKGILKGFSIGGKALAWVFESMPGIVKKVRRITDLLLTEVSLVDRPANPDARVLVYKRYQSQAEIVTACLDGLCELGLEKKDALDDPGEDHLENAKHLRIWDWMESHAGQYHDPSAEDEGALGLVDAAVDHFFEDGEAKPYDKELFRMAHSVLQAQGLGLNNAAPAPLHKLRGSNATVDVDEFLQNFGPQMPGDLRDALAAYSEHPNFRNTNAAGDLIDRWLRTPGLDREISDSGKALWARHFTSLDNAVENRRKDAVERDSYRNPRMNPGKAAGASLRKDNKMKVGQPLSNPEIGDLVQHARWGKGSVSRVDNGDADNESMIRVKWDSPASFTGAPKWIATKEFKTDAKPDGWESPLERQQYQEDDRAERANRKQFPDEYKAAGGGLAKAGLSLAAEGDIVDIDSASAFYAFTDHTPLINDPNFRLVVETLVGSDVSRRDQDQDKVITLHLQRKGDQAIATFTTLDGKGTGAYLPLTLYIPTQKDRTVVDPEQKEQMPSVPSEAQDTRSLVAGRLAAQQDQNDLQGQALAAGARAFMRKSIKAAGVGPEVIAKSSRTWEALKLAVEKYSGKKVRDLEYVRDPNGGYFGVKAKLVDDTPIDGVFEWNGSGTPDHMKLEEADFESWPPTAQGKPVTVWGETGRVPTQEEFAAFEARHDERRDREDRKNHSGRYDIGREDGGDDYAAAAKSRLRKDLNPTQRQAMSVADAHEVVAGRMPASAAGMSPIQAAQAASQALGGGQPAPAVGHTGPAAPAQTPAAPPPVANPIANLDDGDIIRFVSGFLKRNPRMVSGAAVTAAIGGGTMALIPAAVFAFLAETKFINDMTAPVRAKVIAAVTEKVKAAVAQLTGKEQAPATPDQQTAITAAVSAELRKYARTGRINKSFLGMFKTPEEQLADTQRQTAQIRGATGQMQAQATADLDLKQALEEAVHARDEAKVQQVLSQMQHGNYWHVPGEMFDAVRTGNWTAVSQIMGQAFGQAARSTGKGLANQVANGPALRGPLAVGGALVTAGQGAAQAGRAALGFQQAAGGNMKKAGSDVYDVVDKFVQAHSGALSATFTAGLIQAARRGGVDVAIQYLERNIPNSSDRDMVRDVGKLFRALDELGDKAVTPAPDFTNEQMPDESISETGELPDDSGKPVDPDDEGINLNQEGDQLKQIQVRERRGYDASGKANLPPAAPAPQPLSGLRYAGLPGKAASGNLRKGGYGAMLANAAATENDPKVRQIIEDMTHQGGNPFSRFVTRLMNMLNRGDFQGIQEVAGQIEGQERKAAQASLRKDEGTGPTPNEAELAEELVGAAKNKNQAKAQGVMRALALAGPDAKNIVPRLQALLGRGDWLGIIRAVAPLLGAATTGAEALGVAVPEGLAALGEIAPAAAAIFLAAEDRFGKAVTAELRKDDYDGEEGDDGPEGQLEPAYVHHEGDTIHEFFRVNIPSDLGDEEERQEQAVRQAETEASTYKSPCTWQFVKWLKDGETGEVVRTSHTSKDDAEAHATSQERRVNPRSLPEDTGSSNTFANAAKAPLAKASHQSIFGSHLPSGNVSALRKEMSRLGEVKGAEVFTRLADAMAGLDHSLDRFDVNVGLMAYLDNPDTLAKLAKADVGQDGSGSSAQPQQVDDSTVLHNVVRTLLQVLADKGDALAQAQMALYQDATQAAEGSAAGAGGPVAGDASAGVPGGQAPQQPDEGGGGGEIGIGGEGGAEVPPAGAEEETVPGGAGA